MEPAEGRPVPSIAEVYALADAVPPRYRALVLMAAFAGLRRGELFGLTRRDIDPLHRTVTVSIQRQENAHGQPLVGAPKTDAGKRTNVLPKQLLIEIQEHLAPGPRPGLTASSASAPKDRRSGPRSGRRNGTGLGAAWGSTTSTSTIFAILRPPWPRRPAPAPRS